MAEVAAERRKYQPVRGDNIEQLARLRVGHIIIVRAVFLDALRPNLGGDFDRFLEVAAEAFDHYADFHFPINLRWVKIFQIYYTCFF